MTDYEGVWIIKLIMLNMLAMPQAAGNIVVIRMTVTSYIFFACMGLFFENVCLKGTV